MPGVKNIQKGYHDLVRPEVLSRIPATAERILDLGCGTGAMGAVLKRRQRCVVHGIELNKEASDLARKNLDYCWRDNLNRFDPSFIKREYDCIVFGDILEHLVDPWSVLKKFASVLIDDGVIIASIPNVAHPGILYDLSRGLFRYASAGILDTTHLRFFTKTSAFQMFCNAGLKVIDVKVHPADQNPIQYLITSVRKKVTKPDPLVTVLILTHNCWGHTAACLKSLRSKTHLPYKVIVIDNGSKDETVRSLRADRNVYHIENTNNLGFAAGFNIGLSMVDTPYFVICNNDVLFSDYWLSHLVKYIERDPKLMIMGPVSNYVSGPQQIKTPELLSDDDLESFSREIHNEGKAPHVSFLRIVFFCTLFKSEVLRRVGFLDERYGMGNFEDDDYCMAVAARKLKAAFAPSVFIFHHGSQSFKNNNVLYKQLMEKNKKIFMQKWGLS